ADIVAEPLVAAGVERDERLARVESMLEAVDLDARSLSRYPHQFSGGKRQRISIARALVTRPQILVADEPVSALDVSVRAQVLNLLTDLVDDYALTLLFVSHDLGVVRHLCSEVIVMKDGRIVESGATEDIYASHQEVYTYRHIASSPSLADAIAAAGLANRASRSQNHREKGQHVSTISLADHSAAELADGFAGGDFDP